MKQKLLTILLTLVLTLAMIPAAFAAEGKPVIGRQPADVCAPVGANVSFSVTASGEGLSYRWQRSVDGGASWKNCKFDGATSATFSFTASSSYDGWLYRCRVSNSAGTVVSSTAKLTIDRSPRITVQPKNVSAHDGTTAAFSVTAVGDGLSYRWQRSVDGGVSWKNCKFDGATSATFSFPASAGYDGWLYRCRVSNSAGTVTSSAAKLTINRSPRITAQPKSVSAVSGSSTGFSVTAAGDGLSYQWQKSTDGGKTWGKCSSVGADSPVFTFRANVHYDGWMYRCRVSNGFGSVTSAAVKMTVTQPPFAQTPAVVSGGVCIGGLRLPAIYGPTAATAADAALVRDADLKSVWPEAAVQTYVGTDSLWHCTVRLGGKTFSYASGVDGVRYDGTSWYLPCRDFPLALGYSAYMDEVDNLATYTVLPDVSQIPGGRSVPVLMYHAVDETPFTGGIPELFVTPENMEAQLKYMCDNGFTGIWFEDLPNLNAIQKPVILTFDDGYRNNYTVLFPLLKKYNVKATIFIFPNNIGTNRNFLTWDMVKEMADSGLVSFQSHTMSHTELNTLTEAQQRWELAESQRIITAKTGKQTTVLCFPSGKYNSATLALAKEYYQFALKMNGGLYVTGTDRYLIPRYYVSRTTALGSFAAMITH